MDKQAEKHVARVKYAPLTLISIEARAVQLKLKDPLLFNAFQLLEKGEDTAAFLQLYKYAKEGKLKGYDQGACIGVFGEINRPCVPCESGCAGVRQLGAAALWPL